jgi:hypothetical protein
MDDVFDVMCKLEVDSDAQIAKTILQECRLEELLKERMFWERPKVQLSCTPFFSTRQRQSDMMGIYHSWGRNFIGMKYIVDSLAIPQCHIHIKLTWTDTSES